MQRANIAPVDMPQASIGPGIGIFSRYSSVMESDDRPMTVKSALQIISHELDQYLSEQEGEFDAETRFGVTWYTQNGFERASFGDADNLARARGISVEDVRHAGMAESSAGRVRLLRRDELSQDWDPATDTRVTVWECCQHLIRVLEDDGEFAAATLLKRLGPERADAVKDLAYSLYDICSNKRKDAKEANTYNGLIVVWPDLTTLAAAVQEPRSGSQLSMAV